MNRQQRISYTEMYFWDGLVDGRIAVPEYAPAAEWAGAVDILSRDNTLLLVDVSFASRHGLLPPFDTREGVPITVFISPEVFVDSVSHLDDETFAQHLNAWFVWLCSHVVALTEVSGTFEDRERWVRADMGHNAPGLASILTEIV